MGDLVGRIRIEYSGGLPHRCWTLVVLSSFAASVAPTDARSPISVARRAHIPLLQLVRKPSVIRMMHRSASFAVNPKMRLTTLRTCSRAVRPGRARDLSEIA